MHLPLEPNKALILLVSQMYALSYTPSQIINKTLYIKCILKHSISHGRAGRCVAGLRVRWRFGWSVTVEVRNPQSGLVVHTGEPHLQGSYISIRLWVTLSDGQMLFLSKGGCMVSLTIPTGLWALADDGAPDIHRSLSGARQQTRL